MKLYSFPSSPYGRKVMLSALELGLQDQIEVIKTPVFQDESYRKVNPLGRIPALIPEEGAKVLFDSLVICDYLNSLVQDGFLIPKEGGARYQVLRLHALASGTTDATLNLRAQLMRNAKLDNQIPEDWYIDRQKAALYAGLDELENSIEQLSKSINLGILATASLLGYLDFRLDHLSWREGRPNLSGWYLEFSKRPSMQATLPSD